MHNILSYFVIFHLLETALTEYSKLDDTVDLTFSFGNNTLYWKDNQPYVFTKNLSEIHVDSVWYYGNDLCAGERGGTHFDAPYHFNKKGWRVDEIPLSRLIVHGITIDLTNEPKKVGEDVLLLPKHLEEWEKRYGAIPDNSVILVHFGWSEYYHKNTHLHPKSIIQSGVRYPGISITAANWIIRQNKIVGVGVDSPSVDPGKCTSFVIHKLLSTHQIYIMENLKIPSDFPAKGFVLYVMPMKIADGAGAPLRVVAVPYDTGIVPRHLMILKTPWYGHLIVVMSSITLFFLYASNWME